MSQQAHSEHLLEQLRWQRESNVLCDITVVVGDTLFRAHRNVLAAFSGFFSALPDRGHRVTTLNPEFVSEQALDTLLKYIYTGELHTDRSVHNYTGVYKANLAIGVETLFTKSKGV
uniref:BTB domain-containing protein n=1 Tax=Oncorhynchus kisutch TaxID=8019 RepID=A0A8C7CHT8_ONCKI